MTMLENILQFAPELAWMKLKYISMITQRKGSIYYLGKWENELSVLKSLDSIVQLISHHPPIFHLWRRHWGIWWHGRAHRGGERQECAASMEHVCWCCAKIGWITDRVVRLRVPENDWCLSIPPPVMRRAETWGRRGHSQTFLLADCQD